MRVNLKYIAEKANLSPTTVSLILNGKNVRVSQEKRELVLKIAEKYNYKPSSLARALATKKTNIIGLVIPDITNYFFAETALIIETTLRKYGYSLILCNTADQGNDEHKYIDLLLSYGVDGLIICISHDSLFNNDLLHKLNQLEIACVAFDRFIPDLPFPYVSIDNEYGARIATDYLISNGHRKIGFIGGATNVLSARQRFDGYKKSLEKAGITFNQSYVKHGNYQFESGYVAGKELLETNDVSAVFVANDMMAYGFYKAARELGKKIPDDISVVGFDDLLFSEALDVPLTTIKQSTKELAKYVCDILLKEIKGEKVPRNILLNPTLTVRSSVKSLK
ncbi:MAG: LacI family DNA-binding transcriptional regulator [Bacilli bacterium]|jgi:LacI family transcriptional regulator